MIDSYKQVLTSKGYLLNIFLLLYPFFIISICHYFYFKCYIEPIQIIKSTFITVFIFTAIILAYSVISHHKICKILLSVVIVWQYLGLFLNLYHFFVYEQFIGLPGVYALLNTNLAESVEYVGTVFSFKHLFSSIAISFPIVYFILTPPKLPVHNSSDTRRLYKLIPLTLALLFVFNGISKGGMSYWIANNPMFDLTKNICIAISEKAKLKQVYSKINTQQVYPLRSSLGRSTHILIISESINKKHMSIYGYNRNTNPELANLTNKLQIVNDVCSANNTTIPAIRELLTFANKENPNLLFTHPNLIQIMRAAGYKTYWLSNQQEIGSNETFLSVFSRCADYKEFVDKRGWRDGMSLDEKLFGPLNTVLADSTPRKFIIIHLIGAHQRYTLRYPPEYDKFTLAEYPIADGNLSSLSALRTYNEYDNAILYNDHVVRRFIAMTSTLEPVTITYVSDHGEAVGERGDFFGHAENLPYRSISEIPLFFYFSEPFKRRTVHKITNLNINKDKPFQSDDMIHSLLDLYDIRYPILDHKRSLFSSKYSAKPRYCDDLIE